MTGHLALVGSGEFLPAMLDVDRRLLDGRPPRVAVIPTAAAPEGDASLSRWFGLAESHYAGLDAEVVRIDVRDRDGAEAIQNVELLAGCGLIYLSGGNPSFLADTLRGTALGAGIVDAWRAGAAVAGCSAGAMAMGRRTISVRGGSVAGLGLAGRVTTIPHFDRLGFAQRLAGAIGNLGVGDDVVIGVDEETAVLWDPGSQTWTCRGSARTWILSSTGGRGDGFADGDEVALPAPTG